MKFQSIIALSTACALLAACAQPGQQGGVVSGGGLNKQDVGTVAGAGLGVLAGSAIGAGGGRTAAMIGGGLLGAFLGNQVGASLDRADLAAYNQASQRALETAPPGQALPWQGQNASGVIIPSNYYQTSGGQYCREYQQKITVGGKTQQGYGTACRQPDGSWKVVE